MRCPACSAIFKAFRHSGIELDRCVSCGGIWFDAGELEAYRLAQDNPPRPYEFEVVEGAPSLDCPACAKPHLVLGRARDLQIGRCSSCSGFFLPSQGPPTGEQGDPLLAALDVAAHVAFSPDVIEFIAGLVDGL